MWDFFDSSEAQIQKAEAAYAPWSRSRAHDLYGADLYGARFIDSLIRRISVRRMAILHASRNQGPSAIAHVWQFDLLRISANPERRGSDI